MNLSEKLLKINDYFDDIEPDGCCSGIECGCMGKPINIEYYFRDACMEAKEEIEKLQSENEKLHECVGKEKKRLDEFYSYVSRNYNTTPKTVANWIVSCLDILGIVTK